MKYGIFFLTLVAGAAIASETNYIFSPTSLDDSGYAGPFLWTSSQAPSIRYQQVYGNVDFQRSGVQAWRISELIFTTGGGPLDVSLANVQIHLSTTQRPPDGLSTSFAQNVGSDDTLVFSGPLHVFNAQGNNYGTFVPLQRPFDYDWNAGNLLLDVRNFQTLPPQQQIFLFRSSISATDDSSLGIAFDVNSPTAQLSTGALLTEFVVTPIPEPTETTLMILGFTVLACRFRRQLISFRKKGRAW